MAAVAFALPIKPDKVERGYQFVEELTGQRADVHHKRHKMHGLKIMRMWRQHHPLETIIVYLEADDLESTLRSRKSADHEFEKWFDATVREITGHHWADYKTEFLMDWHEQEGHLHKPAPR